jgi:hypothetical protein
MADVVSVALLAVHLVSVLEHLHSFIKAQGLLNS